VVHVITSVGMVHESKKVSRGMSSIIEKNLYLCHLFNNANANAVQCS
jgi:hypothetical protein